MTDKSHEFVVHNFDAVNSYVNQFSERYRVANSIKRSGVFSTYAKWSAILLASGGVAAFLVLWGYSLLKEKPEPKIIETHTIIERPIQLKPNIYVSTTPQPSPASEIRNAAESRVKYLSDQRQQNLSATGTDVQPIYNFTIFKSIPFNNDGINNVIVGMRYKDSTSKKPHVQWCYLLTPDIDGTQIWVTLDGKTDIRGREVFDLTYAQAAKAGTTLNVLRSAQSLCAFE